MSTKDPNLKVIFGADTKDFDKGAKDVKQGLRDLDKVGEGALASLGSAFGVNTGKIGQMTSALKGVGQKLSECGNTGVAAFGNMLKAIGPVGGAIAGLGLGAAIAGFRSLKAEAEAFKNTVQGANIEMATAAYVDTYKQILRDFDGDTGKALALTESKWKKFWGTLGSNFKQLFRTGAFFEAGEGGPATDEYFRRVNAATQGAKEAENLTNQIYELERKRKEQAVDLAKINDQIADKMLIAKDATASTADRNAALAEAEALLAQKKTMTVQLEKDLSDLYQRRSDLASDDVKAADATLAQAARQYDVDRAITQEEASLLRIKNSIGKASEAELAAAKKRTEELEKQKKLLDEHIKAARARNAEIGMALAGAPQLTGLAMGPQMSIRTEEADAFKSRLAAEIGELTLYVGLKADTQSVQDISSEVTSLLQSTVLQTSEIIGNLVGTLIGGGDAWGDFKDAAVAAFGDMAISVGKIAIATGLATIGIQAALKSLNGYVAIAAGAALVALGSAVKSSLSAVASGDYSAGGGYSSGYSGGSSGSDFEAREVQVNVTGTLTANGDQLQAVLNNTKRKNYYTQ